MRRLFFLTLLGLLSIQTGAAGQSLFGSRGLGLPMEPLDARARGLGSVGVGLLGSNLSPADIASAARIFLPTGQLTLQPQWVDGEFGGETTNLRATRFPHLGLAYPVSAVGGTAVMHLGSYLDQRWELQDSSSVELQGSEYPRYDLFRSRGGVSTFFLGWAQRVGDDLSLGFGVGSRIGSVVRTFQRVIDTNLDTDGDADATGGEVPAVNAYQIGGEWQYSGLTAHLGFQWDPIPAIRLGGSMSWSQELKAEAVAAADSTARTFDLPTEFRLGVSGILTPRLAATLGMTYSDWNASGDLLPDAVAGTVWSFGGGLEWAGITRGARRFPVRLGFRRSDLPFTMEGEGPTEQVFTGGIGFNLIPSQSGYTAVMDLGFERGNREAGSVSESFWRTSVTFRVGSF